MRLNAWNGSGFAPLNGPLSELAPRTRTASAEKADPPATGATATYLHIDGAGTITSLFMATGFDGQDTTRLQIFVDGETTPSFDVELGTIMLTHLGSGAQAGGVNAGLGHVYGGNYPLDPQAGWFITFPIPFGNGIDVKLYRPNGTGNGHSLWMNATYTTETSPLRLCASSIPLYTANIAAADSYDLAGATGSGWIVYHALCGVGTEPTWQERNINIYIDGEATPSVASTGTEDYFRHFFYYLQAVQKQFSTPVTTVAYTSGATSCVALDWLKLCGGVRFDAGAIVRLEAEPTHDSSTLQQIASSVWYYREVA